MRWVICPTRHFKLGHFKNGLGHTMILKLWTLDIIELTSPASPSLSSLSSRFSGFNLLFFACCFGSNNYIWGNIFASVWLHDNFILHQNRIFRISDATMQATLNTDCGNCLGKIRIGQTECLKGKCRNSIVAVGISCDICTWM